MPRKIEDVTKEEIKNLRDNIYEISISPRYSKASIKVEKIKIIIKDFFNEFSYLEIFNQYKDAIIDNISNETYGPVYLAALNDLLEEKKKELSLEEIDELLDYFQNETNKTRKFSDDTKETLLSDNELRDKSMKLLDDNIVRISYAASEGKMNKDEKEVFQHTKNEDILKKSKKYLDVLYNSEEDLSREISSRIDEETNSNTKNL